MKLMTDTVMNCGTTDHQKRIDAELDHLAEKHGTFRDPYDTAHYREIKQRLFELGSSREACKKAIDIMVNDLHSEYRGDWYGAYMWSYAAYLKRLLDEATRPTASARPELPGFYVDLSKFSETTQCLKASGAGWANGPIVLQTTLMLTRLIRVYMYPDDPKASVLQVLAYKATIDLTGEYVVRTTAMNKLIRKSKGLLSADRK